ncbi:Cof-type HAD-IIB family hydrolase [Hydrogenibacillus sp. N12]|uniref:Cof-type HAD-IIB family hydrolase n=1 Tax=Hydrogenibacillus sp. N12 TaxID=2866627 RepID=UPI001C7CA29F|nr:Cof-type HAD-IIB family hydrolase [Hydrogenibacillus sp. N12]QZA32527.1 Cof-type HAD-IIB family hydrolase [Hydrogenibacillus sp. N12]
MARDFRMVLVDLDGTALTSEKTITPRTRSILTRLEASGVRVVIATGRAIYSVRTLFQDVPFQGPVIALNGAAIFSGLTGPLWHVEAIDAEALDLTMAVLGQERRIRNLLFEAPDAYFVSRFDDEVRTTFADYRNLEPHPLEPDRVRQAPVTNILVRPEEPDKEAVHAYLSALLGAHVRFIRTTWTWLEGLKAGVTKATAMHVLARRFGISPSEIVAVGDEWNDVEMLREAGLGIAMANGSDLAKAAADVIAPPNDEDGLARVLEDVFAVRLKDGAGRGTAGG